MTLEIQELRERIESIAEINDASQAEKALYALDRLLDHWAEHELAL